MVSGVVAHIYNSPIWEANQEDCEFRQVLKKGNGIVITNTVIIYQLILCHVFVTSVVVKMGIYQTSL